MAESKKRGLTAEQHEDAKSSYYRGENMNSICRRLGLRYATVAAMAKREMWTVEPTVKIDGPKVQARAQATVIDMASRKVLETGEGQKAVEQAAQAVADSLAAAATLQNALARTATIADKAARYFDEFLDEALAGKVCPGERQSKADVASAIMAAYTRWTSTVRESAGRRPGQANVPDDAAAGKPRALKFVVAARPNPDRVDEVS